MKETIKIIEELWPIRESSFCKVESCLVRMWPELLSNVFEVLHKLPYNGVISQVF